MHLRYVGPHPITFADPRVGEVHPGDEFEVPDDLAGSFTSRADVEPAEAAPPPRARKGKTSPASDDPTALTTEEAGDAVPDDH